MKIIKLICLLIIAIFLANPMYAELSKESLYNELKSKYQGLESISFNYSYIDNPQINGYIKAKTGNRYIISLADRDIISNSQTIWNISKADNKVIISNYKDTGDESLSIENIFFHFLDKYEATKLTKDNTSKGVSHYVLTLTPKNTESEVYDIKSITLWLGFNDIDIKKVRLNGYNINSVFSLSDIKRNNRIKNSEFDFKPDEGMDVIDLR